MPKFVTIHYGDRADYEATSAAVRAAAHVHDRRLALDGALVGAVGAPTLVRNPDGTGIHTERAAFMSSELPVAGFEIIEAPSMEEAVEMMSGTPCATCRGVVEIWPLDEMRPFDVS